MYKYLKKIKWNNKNEYERNITPIRKIAIEFYKDDNICIKDCFNIYIDILKEKYNIKITRLQIIKLRHDFIIECWL